jgi:hypothetical protein
MERKSKFTWTKVLAVAVLMAVVGAGTFVYNEANDSYGLIRDL